jgi:hypothetical protein
MMVWLYPAQAGGAPEGLEKWRGVLSQPPFLDLDSASVQKAASRCRRYNKPQPVPLECARADRATPDSVSTCRKGPSRRPNRVASSKVVAFLWNFSFLDPSMQQAGEAVEEKLGMPVARWQGELNGLANAGKLKRSESSVVVSDIRLG